MIMPAYYCFTVAFVFARLAVRKIVTDARNNTRQMRTGTIDASVSNVQIAANQSGMSESNRESCKRIFHPLGRK
jgi:hypothetical protein